jgi:hypothetical protein
MVAKILGEPDIGYFPCRGLYFFITEQQCTTMCKIDSVIGMLFNFVKVHFFSSFQVLASASKYLQVLYIVFAVCSVI